MRKLTVVKIICPETKKKNQENNFRQKKIGLQLFSQNALASCNKINMWTCGPFLQKRSSSILTKISISNVTSCVDRYVTFPRNSNRYTWSFLITVKPNSSMAEIVTCANVCSCPSCQTACRMVTVLEVFAWVRNISMFERICAV